MILGLEIEVHSIWVLWSDLQEYKCNFLGEVEWG